MKGDLANIKAKYGEKMAHLCRELFPSLLETEGLLYELLKISFAPTKFLYDDLINQDKVKEFRNYIYSLQKQEEKEEEIVDKTPQELLDEAGYTLYTCNSEKEIQQFKKYYQPGEYLCTFRGGRLESNYVFFAVSKNVQDIKREDFKHPERQDAYGTSVISIQFTRGDSNMVSIKNRYNHKVKNCDATFSNNLDSIIPGLKKSFEQTYQLKIRNSKKNNLDLDGYVMANNGKYYKYNYEIHNIYYCCDNTIIDHFEVKTTYQQKERYIVCDYFILDMKEKKIFLYDQSLNVKECFTDGLQNIDKITIKKEGNNKYICLQLQEHLAIIGINKENKIISYQNNGITKVGDFFLHYNKTLIVLELKNAKKIGNACLLTNKIIKMLDISSVEEIGNYFLFENRELNVGEFPSLQEVGEHFMSRSKNMRVINAPLLKKVGSNFLSSNESLQTLDFPNLTYTEDDFIHTNRIINSVNMPCLEIVGSRFLAKNQGLKVLYLPKLKQADYGLLQDNQTLEEVYLPSLEACGRYYLEKNTTIIIVEVPEEIRNTFIFGNKSFSKNFKKQKQKKKKLRFIS